MKTRQPENGKYLHESRESARMKIMISDDSWMTFSRSLVCPFSPLHLCVKIKSEIQINRRILCPTNFDLTRCI